MKKKILILIALFVALVVAFTPARLAELFIPQSNGLVVGSFSGSIWAGKISHIQFKQWKLNDIDYSLNFLPLIIGTLSGESEVNDGDLQGDFSFAISGNDLSLNDVNIEIEASRFESSIPLPGIIVGGVATSDNFDVNFIQQKPVYLEGKTSWTNANVSINGMSWDLGNFDILWNTNQDTGLITGNLSKMRKNQLGIEGQVTLNDDGMLEFRGSILASIDQNIFAAFSLFSNGPVKDGRLPIKFKKKIF